MANPYFQFKQFTIYQDQCAMKVCTDACILGAWFSEKTPSFSSILDIGSGTGLLMLMLAQKHRGDIQGIELDLAAFKQLKENVGNSRWKEDLKVFPGDIRQFNFTHKFDFIITNPPFYEGDLEADNHSKNLARHSKELTLAELLTAIDSNLSAEGTFGILLPSHRLQAFESLARARHFHLRERLLVRQTPRHDVFRGVLHFSRNKETFIPETELTIQDEKGVYTEEFVELMRDYYLKL